MKIQVVGKKFLEGTSKKSGKPYKATLVSMIYPYGFYEGHKAEEVYISSELIDFKGVEIGGIYNLERDNGFILEFTKSE